MSDKITEKELFEWAESCVEETIKNHTDEAEENEVSLADVDIDDLIELCQEDFHEIVDGSSYVIYYGQCFEVFSILYNRNDDCLSFGDDYMKGESVDSLSTAFTYVVFHYLMELLNDELITQTDTLEAILRRLADEKKADKFGKGVA